MISLTVAGDISFSQLANFEISANVEFLLRKSDLVIGNLEAIFTNRTKKRNLRPYYLKANPRFSGILNSFDAFSMANNHVLDYRAEGLADTIDILKSLQKGYFGAGLKRRDAEKPFTYEKDGIRIALLGVTHYVCSGILHSAGTANMHATRLSRQIRKLKEQGYFVIIMPHWGYEHIPYPSPKERTLARRIIKAGADIIIGSHSHEMQSHEIIDGKHVFYSLGNFIFSSKDFIQNDNPYLYESIMVQLKINPDHSYSCELIPYVTSDTKVEIASAEKSDVILQRLDQISKPLLKTNAEFSRLFYQTMFNRYLLIKNRVTKGVNPAVQNTVWHKYRKYVLLVLNINWQSFKLIIDTRLRLLTKKANRW